jgi:hypothetical protein
MARIGCFARRGMHGIDGRVRMPCTGEAGLRQNPGL